MSPIVYIAAVLVAVGFGALVFLLFWGREATVADAGAIELDAPPTAVSPSPTQRPTFAQAVVQRLPGGYVGWLQRQITLAGRPGGWTVDGIVAWKLLLVGVGGGVALLVILANPNPLNILLCTLGVVMLFVLPDVLINSRSHDRQKAIQTALPDTLDQMTIAVEAGLGFDAAMEKAARNSNGPLSDELIRTLQDMSVGRTRREAFHELQSRTSSDDLHRFARAIIQADSYGVAIGGVLRIQASEMRTKRRQRAEEQAQKVQIKVLFPLIFCLMPVIFIVVLTPVVVNIMKQFG